MRFIIAFKIYIIIAFYVTNLWIKNATNAVSRYINFQDDTVLSLFPICSELESS